MKIAFLCGSLEPGRDGVGDYVRRLAEELRQQGQEVAAIALNDPYAPVEMAAAAPGSLPLLRLPAAWPAGRRFARARQWLDEFDPAWVSLQFVPFAFHPKGLPFGLGRQLARLGQGRAWHLMMHELWVGMDEAAPRKFVWWGRVQRYLIQDLITRLAPPVIHTQTLLYQAQLAKLGFRSSHLPLFSNIPLHFSPVTQPAPPLPKAVRLVIFGTIHPDAPAQQFARDAAQYAQQHGATVTLLMVGRCGREQPHWAGCWQAAGLPLEILGEQTPAQISAVLAGASLGITTTPALLVGKSGTAAAMQEHGLPVLCVAHPWFPQNLKHLSPPSGVVIYEPGNFAAYLAAPKSVAVANKAAAIASQLLEQLSGH